MKIQRTLAVIGVWASLGCGQLAAQTRTGQRFTLTGTVVDGVSNRPISGVEVSLQTEKWEAVDAPVVSDAQGRFAFGGLSAGEYILSAEAAGIGTVHYGEAPDPGWVSTVHATGDKSLVFRIVPRGAIEGVVRDEFGDPMMGAMVSIGRPLWREGRTTMANVGQKSTDDRGRYRFGSLAPGNYVACAGGSQNAAPVEGPVDYTARVDNRFYTRPDCIACPIKYLCGGGCRMNSLDRHGDIRKPDEVDCFLKRRMFEEALWIMCELGPEALQTIFPKRNGT